MLGAFDPGIIKISGGKKRERTVQNMSINKMEEFIAALKKREDEQQKNTLLCILAIIGAVAAVAGIAFAVYRYFSPDCLDDFEEEFEDDFDDYFKDEE